MLLKTPKLDLKYAMLFNIFNHLNYLIIVIAMITLCLLSNITVLDTPLQYFPVSSDTPNRRHACGRHCPCPGLSVISVSVPLQKHTGLRIRECEAPLRQGLLLPFTAEKTELSEV